jgi:AraC-like DNA-binding protein
MSSGYQTEVGRFIRGAISSEPEDLDFIVRTYLLQPVTLEDLAGLTNRSLASFKRDFRHKYQCAPRQWINRERLGQARLLLQNTDQRIAEIAESCGFESASYFIRLFRREYNCTPNEWRAGIVID